MWGRGQEKHGIISGVWPPYDADRLVGVTGYTTLLTIDIDNFTLVNSVISLN